MSPIGERLRLHWSAQGVVPPPGVPEERLREFERRHGVTLPADLRGYLLDVDGMGTRGESDGDWFSFWPLTEIVPASDEYEDPFIDSQASYFVFADHSVCLPAYAIRLTRSGAGPHIVIAIYSDNREYSTEVVARSFAEFIERYLACEWSRQDLGAGIPIEP
jgi:hypothetical protein